MKAFAELVDKLYFTSGNIAKATLIKDYLSQTADPDRGWAIAAIAGTLSFDFFKRKLIKELITERIDPVLFELSYDYVGEMSETVAHLWQRHPHESITYSSLPSLHEVVHEFQTRAKSQQREYLINLLNSMNAMQRWALLKLGTRGLRIGVSARFLKKTLAEYGQSYNPQVTLECVERLWHGLEPPYLELLAWLEGRGQIPDVSDSVTFQPVMLSHPMTQDDLYSLDLSMFSAEWKYDGIRIQLVVTPHGKALFSRTGDDISQSFPDIIEPLELDNIHGIFDGELIALTIDSSNNNSTANIFFSGISDIPQQRRSLGIGSFNQLQQRLNKKRPSRQLIARFPVGIILYDCLVTDRQDLRDQPLAERQRQLSHWYLTQPYNFLYLSRPLAFSTQQHLIQLRKQAEELSQGFIEGLMLKNSQSPYIAGRPKGLWYKWKRDPLLIDTVVMYAQRGHGKRSSFYSDFTFGCWQDDQLLPVGKAYSGFTDEELTQLDRWVRNNTIGRFGPVKEVNKSLVFEVAFDSVHLSNRHKSGVAMRFPRIHRIRWDKPANEADTVANLRKLIL